MIGERVQGRARASHVASDRCMPVVLPVAADVSSDNACDGEEKSEKTHSERKSVESKNRREVGVGKMGERLADQKKTNTLRKDAFISNQWERLVVS